jgi:hypothetical protein
MSSLRELQHRMAAAVMHPLTANDTTPVRLRAEAEAIVKANDRLNSLERLEIYSRSYWFRVLDALAEDFPGARAVLGVSRFHALSRDYLNQHPSTSFTLRNLGSHFVEWLEAILDPEAPGTALVLDMGRLEWAHIEAFDAAERPAISPEAWAHAGAEAILPLQPYIRLVQAQYAVDDLLLDIRKIEDSNAKIATWRRKHLARISTAPCCIVVHRSDYSVCYRRVSPEAFRMLEALRNGRVLGEALEDAFRGSTLPEKECAAQVQLWFSLWMSLGWFSA